MALVKLINKKYTVKNMYNQQKPAKYVQVVARHTKDANIDAMYNQLTFAYKNIITEL